jgi:hypothetical protein
MAACQRCGIEAASERECMELTEPFRSIVYCRHEKGLVGFLGLERNAADLDSGGMELSNS